MGWLNLVDLRSDAAGRPPHLEACRPIEADARRVMAWRNDPDTLAMSFHRAPKLWEQFWPEFRDSYFTRPRLPPLFVLAEPGPVAFLRYRPVPHPSDERVRTVDVSLNVAPGARGRGIGRAALRLGAGFLREHAGLDCVLAEVRVANGASRRLFEAAGFQALGEVETRVVDTGERCRIVRFTYDLVPARSCAGPRA